jgi:hypothetical protein
VRSPPRPASRSTPCGSATSTATLRPALRWLRRAEIGRDGAILVRPDRFVAWRQATASENPRAVLTEALGKVLAQPVGVELASVA